MFYVDIMIIIIIIITVFIKRKIFSVGKMIMMMTMIAFNSSQGHKVKEFISETPVHEASKYLLSAKSSP